MFHPRLQQLSGMAGHEFCFWGRRDAGQSAVIWMEWSRYQCGVRRKVAFRLSKGQRGRNACGRQFAQCHVTKKLRRDGSAETETQRQTDRRIGGELRPVGRECASFAVSLCAPCYPPRTPATRSQRSDQPGLDKASVPQRRTDCINSTRLFCRTATAVTSY